MDLKVDRRSTASTIQQTMCIYMHLGAGRDVCSWSHCRTTIVGIYAFYLKLFEQLPFSLFFRG